MSQIVPPGLQPKRCAIYTRKSVSTGLEKDFNSLDAQREACEAYIQRQHNWTLVPDRFDDGGFTGANTERPAFQRLLADIEAKKIDIVVVYKVDRLSRSLLDFAKLIERFDKAGAAFVSVTQSFSTADPMGKLTLNILMSFAEFEREMIASRTRDKVQAARRRGLWTGGPIPLGYTVQNGKLVIDEDEAVVVREIFSLYLQHRSHLRIIDELTTRGRSTKRRAGDGKPLRGVRLWTKDALLRILKNPIYLGKTRIGKETFSGEHPALIEQEIWNRVQATMAEKPTRRPRPASVAFLLRGLVCCQGCRRVMSAVSSKRGRKLYRYYRCDTPSKQRTVTRCCPPLPATPLEEFVVNVLREQVVTTHFQQQVEGMLSSRLTASRTALERERASLPRSIGLLANDLRGLMDLASQAPESARRALLDRVDQVNRVMEAQQVRLASVEQELVSLGNLKARADALVATLKNFDGVWRQFSDDEKEKWVSCLVSRVVVDEASGQAHLDLDLPLLGAIDALGVPSTAEAAE